MKAGDMDGHGSGGARSAVLYHGGNLAAARDLFPHAPPPWIDLSTGINPEPYPLPTLAASAWTRLPDPADLAALEAVAARAYGAASPKGTVAAPGTQALLQWLPRLLQARRVGVLGFTYAEHGRTWRAAGAEVLTAERLADLADVDVAVVVNPNNPDGRLVPAADLVALAGTLARRGGTVVVDEAFMDVMRPDASLVPLLPPAGAVVLRSFGKAYGLPGARLGFAIAPAELAARLRVALGPWCVPGPAIAVGRAALVDPDWLAGSVGRLEAAARRLDALLECAGFTIEGGTPLFRLAAHASGSDWFRRFGRAGILTRPFGDRPGWLRFGIPGREDEWSRLDAALHTVG